MTHPRTLTTRASRARAAADAVLADAGATAALDAVVTRALERTGADAAQISMMSDRVISLCPAGAFAGVVPAGAHHPFEETLCAYALRADDSLVIPDARADQRVAGVGAVASGLVGAYLGAPIRSRDSEMVGVLCLFSLLPREWTAAEQAELTDLAAEVSDELARRSVAAGGGY